MTADDARYAARVLAAQNAKLSRRAEAATHVVLFVVFALGGAWALLAWATPCEAGTLCMVAAVTRTRTSWPQRIANRVRAALLRWRLRDLEATLAYVEDDLQSLPEVRRSLRVNLDVARIRLIEIELSGRSHRGT